MHIQARNLVHHVKSVVRCQVLRVRVVRVLCKGAAHLAQFRVPSEVIGQVSRRKATGQERASGWGGGREVARRIHRLSIKTQSDCPHGRWRKEAQVGLERIRDAIVAVGEGSRREIPWPMSMRGGIADHRSGYWGRPGLASGSDSRARAEHGVTGPQGAKKCSPEAPVSGAVPGPRGGSLGT